MPDPIRERVLSEIQSVFRTATGSGGNSFAAVYDAPVDGREYKGQNVLAVIESTEIYIEVVSPDKRDRRIDVELQAVGYCPRNTTPRAYANSLLADMEEIVEANRFWGGNAYATLFLSNTVERINTADRTVEVVLFIAVQYRTKRSDPRS